MKDGSLDGSSSSRVSDVVCFVVPIAPYDNALLVSESIRSKRLTCPFLYQLFCEGRFVYIVNKDTTVEVLNLKKLEQESADIKQGLAGFKQKLEHLSNNMEEVKELLSEILTEMKRVLVRISN